MGLPELYFSYQTAAQTAVSRSKQGIVALLLQDAGLTAGVYTVAHEADIPTELGEDNREHVRRAMVGYVNQPAKIYLSVVGAAGTVADAMEQVSRLNFDYVAGWPDLDATEAEALAKDVITRRKKNFIGKAVVPGYAADDVGVINVVAEDIKTAAGAQNGITLKAGTCTAAQYCARIAGLLAGTPAEGSATGAALGEVENVKAMTDTELDTAIEAGKFVLYDDGRKIRVARAVNSSTTSAAGSILRKIKAAEIIDLIHYYAVTTADDEYRGQCANTYDNKCLLVAAVQGYLTSLEPELLSEGTGKAEIDVDAVRAWLKEQGTAVEDMTEDEIRKADTGSYVFIALSGYIVDAMEDFSISLALSNA